MFSIICWYFWGYLYLSGGYRYIFVFVNFCTSIYLFTAIVFFFTNQGSEVYHGGILLNLIVTDWILRCWYCGVMISIFGFILWGSGFSCGVHCFIFAFCLVILLLFYTLFNRFCFVMKVAILRGCAILKDGFSLILPILLLIWYLLSKLWFFWWCCDWQHQD